MDTKKCSQCNQVKSNKDFYFWNKRGYYNKKCRNCEAINTVEKRKITHSSEELKRIWREAHHRNKEKHNECSRQYHWQNRDKLLENMKKRYNNNQEYYKQKAKDYREQLRENSLAGKLKKPTITFKKCYKCHEEKSVSEFTFRKTRNVYDSICKICNMERERTRRELYKDDINKKRREVKKPLTPEQKMTMALRNRTNKLIKNRTGKNLYYKLLSCDKKFLIKWFEYQLCLDEELGMNWENYGSLWHIDHVKPCASFDLLDEKQQIICFHWTNIAPVLKPYNLSKGSKIIKTDIIKQKKKVYDFLEKLDDSSNYKYSLLEDY